jgi:hypothetical protein
VTVAAYRFRPGCSSTLAALLSIGRLLLQSKLSREADLAVSQILTNESVSEKQDTQPSPRKADILEGDFLHEQRHKLALVRWWSSTFLVILLLVSSVF